MRLQTVRALYKGGTLIFANPALTPQDGAEIVVTYLEELPPEAPRGEDPLQALRGRGKGEHLVERLLRARREDREHNEQTHRRLRA